MYSVRRSARVTYPLPQLTDHNKAGGTFLYGRTSVGQTLSAETL
jgi:hypothetical protein